MAEEKAATAVDTELRPLAEMSEEDRASFYKTLGGEEPLSEEGEEPSESGAAPDAATKTKESAEEEQPRETRGERRFKKLTAYNKQLEARIKELEAKPGNERPSERQTERQPSKAPKLKSFTDQIGVKYPDYDSAHEAWEDAQDAHFETQRKEAVAEALKAERDKLTKAEQEAEANKTVEANAKKFADRSKEFRKTLSEDKFVEHFTEVKESIDDVMAERPEMGEIGDALLEMENGPAIVDYLGANLDVLDALLALPLRQALRELGKLEASDKVKTPPPKTHTSARRIGNRVPGSQASASNPEDAAVEKNDMAGFLRARKTEVTW